MERKLNRQILFNKSSAPKEEIKKVPPPVQKAEPPPKAKESDKELSPQEKSNKIKEWLKTHKLFKPSVIAAEIGMDKGNWSRTLKDGDIPEKYLDKIIEILKQYGFEL